jgi:hypothetical protein
MKLIHVISPLALYTLCAPNDEKRGRIRSVDIREVVTCLRCSGSHEVPILCAPFDPALYWKYKGVVD